MPVERTPKAAGAARQQNPTSKRAQNGARQARGGAGKQRGGGGVRKQGPQRLKEYEDPIFLPAESVQFTMENWHDVETTLARSGIKNVTFRPDCRISNDHLQILASHPQVAGSLELLSLGDEETGNGTLLTDEGILRLVSATPHLRVLRLWSCLNLTDATLVNVLTHCPRLESLRISGNDKGRGRITHKGLKGLKERPDIGFALKDLLLLSQSISGTAEEREAKALTKAKKGLALTIGTCSGRYDDDGAPDPVYFNGKIHMFGMPV